MLILGVDPLEANRVVKGISAGWQIKDLGDVNQILGLQVTRDTESRTLKIHQKPYIEALIRELGLQGAKPINTPITDRNILYKTRADEQQADQLRYQKLIGHLNWISGRTRPDNSTTAHTLQHRSVCGIGTSLARS
jgi:hypothetical protein